MQALSFYLGNGIIPLFGSDVKISINIKINKHLCSSSNDNRYIDTKVKIFEFGLLYQFKNVHFIIKG